MNVWILAKRIDDKAWSFMGVFADYDCAVRICKEKGDNYFLGPAKVNELIGDQDIPWPGAKYASQL